MSKGCEQEIYRRNPKACIKKMSNSLLIRGIQIKTMRYCFIITLAKLEIWIILRVNGLWTYRILHALLEGVETQLGTDDHWVIKSVHIHFRDTAVLLQLMSPREILTKTQKERQERTFITALCRRELEAV